MDAQDFRLLAELTRDPRQSFRALGRVVGMSAPAVRDRVQRLLSGGAIAGFGLWVDPSLFGRQEVVGLFTGERTAAEVHGLLGHPEVPFVWWKVDGGLSLMVWSKEPARTLEGVERALGAKAVASFATAPRPATPLSRLDLAILEALVGDPVLPFGDLTAACGLSPKTVRRHLQRLTDQGVVQILPNLVARSGPGELVYQLQVYGPAPPSSVQAVAPGAVPVHDAGQPPARFYLCQGREIAEVLRTIRAVEQLPGVASVRLSLNREAYYSPAPLRALLAEARGRLGPPGPRRPAD